jgi:hypothetical protein
MLESRCRCWSGRNVGGAERVARGSWRCGQVLSGRSRAGPWARADGAEVRRAEQRHVESCCARCRNAMAVSRTQLRCSTKCRYTRCWRTRGSYCWASRQGCKTPSGGCCDGVQGNGAQVRRDKAEANAGPTHEEEKE